MLICVMFSFLSNTFLGRFRTQVQGDCELNIDFKRSNILYIETVFILCAQMEWKRCIFNLDCFFFILCCLHTNEIFCQNQTRKEFKKVGKKVNEFVIFSLSLIRCTSKFLHFQKKERKNPKIKCNKTGKTCDNE